jgi:MYXO-CTERM domain-containing protein
MKDSAMNRRLTGSLGICLALGLLFGAGAAQAQSLRPNILVIFDTSGSMLDGNSNDGSALCGGNGTGSRIYSLKRAMREALAQVGTDEANFGLMRFAQIERPTQNPTCSRGHYANDNTTALSGSGGTCTGGCGNSCRCGCRIPGHTEQTTYGTWFDNNFRSAVVVDVTNRPTGLKPVAADFDPADGNIADIYRWIDLTEDTDTTAPISDPELRSEDNWYTPLGRSLFYARMYFDNFVKPTDPKGACRTNRVILVTDGAETCDETAGSALDLTTCAQTGYDTFNPTLQACQLLRTSGIRVNVLTDTNTGSSNDSIAMAGGTTTAIRVSLTDANAVKAALLGIIAETVPPTEVCNGVDDNCNGLIDEGVSNMCVVANPNNPNDPDNLLGTGARHCAVETCNCLDDDCDGTVDEGFPQNACGQPCGCAVPPELCDGLDNDCDGDIDEGFMVGATCTNNGVGACRRGGLLACNANGSGTFCDAPTVTPQPEVCNGIDDNCNGMIDEGTLPGVGERCGNGLGTCQAGTYVCMNGKLVCNATGIPMPEICNGIDDNCDGVVDNGTFPQTGQTCLCPGVTQAHIDAPNGTCKGGRLICRGTMGFVCEGCVLPGIEICDGKDNDCDGMTDTVARCPSGFGCRDGQCALQCGGGEFPCPAGYKCMNDFCVPQRCIGVTCPAGQKCEEATGACVDLCSGVTCPSPKTCMQGRCLDCNDPELACTGGKLCIAGVCQTDKCMNVTCPEGTFCSDGACKDLCVPGKCPEGQRCAAGQCLSDACTQIACNQGQFCNQSTGKCETDHCLTTQCGAGMACVSQTSTCKPDPCRTIVCPDQCWHCGLTSDGIGTCLLNDECAPVNNKVGQRGGGEGCACATGGDAGSSTGWLGALFAVAAAFGRRRRR